MIKKSATIVFFGSGPVAAKSLELLNKNFVVEAVITKTTPAHHKDKIPVADLAGNLGIKLFNVDSKIALDNLINAESFVSNLGILVDFGIIVSKKTIDYFPKGIINSHFSVLPQWRGADPITFALLSGQKRTGVSLMQLVESMDEGPLLAYRELDIDPEDNNASLTQKLITLSYSLLSDFISKYLNGESELFDQNVTGYKVSYSRKLSKNDGIIDWKKPANKIEQEIRAYSDWPKSRTTLANLELIITKAHVVASIDAQPGDYKYTGSSLVISCDQDALSIDRLKPSSKPEMTISAFLAGYGTRL